MGLRRYDGSGIRSEADRGVYFAAHRGRAVLRFALSFPNVPADAAYVTEQRKTNAQGVSEAEEILKLEQAK